MRFRSFIFEWCTVSKKRPYSKFPLTWIVFEQKNQALIIKKDGNRHNFGLKTSTRKKLMLVLYLFIAGKYKNLQTNCIIWLLTALSIRSTLFLTSICQQFAPKVFFFSDVARFLQTRLPYFFLLHLSHL